MGRLGTWLRRGHKSKPAEPMPAEAPAS
jgi:hypothetical protein